MKRIFCLGLLLSSVLGFSQLREKGAIEITPLVGYASANYYGEEELSNDPISSVNFGADADYFFNDRWSLRSGLLFQTMGSEVIPGYKEKLGYLTIPVNANWHFGSTRKWNLNFGPSASFLLSAKGNGEDIKDFVKPFQLGLNVGIGYKIEVSEKFSILIDYQALVGLTEVDKYADITLKNNHGAFNVGGVIKL